jgi:hypothetical protein
MHQQLLLVRNLRGPFLPAEQIRVQSRRVTQELLRVYRRDGSRPRDWVWNHRGIRARNVDHKGLVAAAGSWRCHCCGSGGGGRRALPWRWRWRWR